MDLETGDIIDLSALDANTRTAKKDDAFTFVGEGAFSGTAGELRFEASEDGGCVVMGDIDGDGAADFQLYIASTDTVTADYFVL